MKFKLLILAFFACYFSSAQNINESAEKVKLFDQRVDISSMAFSKDYSTLLIGIAKSKKLIYYNWKQRKIDQEITLNEVPKKFKIYVSNTGKYLLLQEQRLAYSTNTVRELSYTVVDYQSGKTLITLARVHDAKITPDEKYLVVLEKNTLKKIDLSSGNIVKKQLIKNARNALAVTSDNQILIAHKPNLEELKQHPSMRNNKRALKPSLKFREMISSYDFQSFQRMAVIPEIYDVVNQINCQYSKNKVTVYSIPHTKYNNIGFQGTINVIELPDNIPTRESYMSRSSIQPDFKYSANEQFFGTVSQEQFPTINIYDTQTYSLVDAYDTQLRILKSAKKGEYMGKSACFVFTPNNQVIIAYGNTLIYWTMEL